MTSPVDGNESFGYLQIQYTYRFLGKTRGDDGQLRYDVTDIQSVRDHHMNNLIQSGGTEVTALDELSE